MSKQSPHADASLALAVAYSGFAGHVRKDSVIVARYGPGELPGCPRATITILLYPQENAGRCGVVDLLHPSERNTPRCGNPECRCMTEVS